MTNPQGVVAEDAERWWRAYQLAENDQAGELREHAQAGDEHARRQLAGWLADRARTEEAIEVIRPLADAGDEVAEHWLARGHGSMRVVRLAADLGDAAAVRQLERWLSRLHQRAADDEESAREFLAENPDWQQDP